MGARRGESLFSLIRIEFWELSGVSFIMEFLTKRTVLCLYATETRIGGLFPFDVALVAAAHNLDLRVCYESCCDVGSFRSQVHREAGRASHGRGIVGHEFANLT